MIAIAADFGDKAGVASVGLIRRAIRFDGRRRRDREIGGFGEAGYVSVTRGVGRDSRTGAAEETREPGTTVRGAAEVRGVDHSGSATDARIDLDYERLVQRAVGARAGARPGAISGREAGRKNLAGDIYQTGGVDCDRGADCRGVPIQDAGVVQDRIDNQRPRPIVRTDMKARDGSLGIIGRKSGCAALAARQHIVCSDLDAYAVRFLIDERLEHSNRPGAGVQHQITGRTQLGTIEPPERELDLPRIRAGADHEVVLQPMSAAVIDEVDSGRHSALDDLAVNRDVGAPFRRVVADQVIDVSAQRLPRSQQRIRRRALQPYSQRARRLVPVSG